MKFIELDLPAPLLRAVEDLGFTDATEIQEQALPHLIDGRDVAGQAQTGTGKTACFLLATMNRLLAAERPSDGSPRALVVAPTRELAMQIAADGKDLAVHTGLKIALAYGGTRWRKQADDIAAGVDIVVGTPGRLIDYQKSGVLNLRKIEVVVIDEADRMFDMGFIQDLTYLFRRCPPRERRQSLLFSATLSDQVMRLARQHMNEPVEVSVAPDQLIVDGIDEELYHVSSAEKVEFLLGLIEREKPTRSMIFVNRKVDGEELVWRLNGNGQKAVYISGDLPQNKRSKIIAALKEGRIGMLVATDVASRGLHVSDVSHVFNFDVPQDPEDYVHRIGRTARAGASGKAITLACDDYAYCLSALEEYLTRKVPVRFPEGDIRVTDRAGYFRRRRGYVYSGWEDAMGEGTGRRKAAPASDQGDAPAKPKRRRSRSKSAEAADAPAPSVAAEAAESAPPAKKQRATKRVASKANGGDKAPSETKTHDKAPKAEAAPARRPRRSRERRRIGDGLGLTEQATAE